MGPAQNSMKLQRVRQSDVDEEGQGISSNRQLMRIVRQLSNPDLEAMMSKQQATIQDSSKEGTNQVPINTVNNPNQKPKKPKIDKKSKNMLPPKHPKDRDFAPKKGSFLPDIIQLREEHKPYSKQSKDYNNLIDVIMTPRQRDSGQRKRGFDFEMNQYLESISDGKYNTDTLQEQTASSKQSRHESNADTDYKDECSKQQSINKKKSRFQYGIDDDQVSPGDKNNVQGKKLKIQKKKKLSKNKQNIL